MTQIAKEYWDINRVSKYFAHSNDLAIISGEAIDLEKIRFEKYFSKSLELAEYSQSIPNKPRLINWLYLNYGN